MAEILSYIKANNDQIIFDLSFILSGLILLFNGTAEEKLMIIFDLLLDRQIEDGDVDIDLNVSCSKDISKLSRKSVNYFVYNVFNFFLGKHLEVSIVIIFLYYIVYLT